jgi:aspartokinase-like uncharacterized kinase
VKILVCGGRDYADSSRVWGVLDAFHRSRGHVHVIQGGARGADQIAREWAQSKQLAYSTIIADWAQHGAAAGPIRNQRMLDELSPDLVLAFPGGRGTADMVRRAKARGFPVELAL